MPEINLSQHSRRPLLTAKSTFDIKPKSRKGAKPEGPDLGDLESDLPLKPAVITLVGFGSNSEVAFRNKDVR
jgi:hypothetical protein